jgi:hypothetical protein
MQRASKSEEPRVLLSVPHPALAEEEKERGGEEEAGHVFGYPVK